MGITQRGSTTNATTATANSLACNKPTGVVSGDVLLALVTTNAGNITSPGWTKIGSDVGTNPFGATWLYKVAGGSESSSYTFSNDSGTAPPILVSITAWTGVDTTGGPVGGSTITGSATSSEPKNIPGCTNTPLALPFYSRSCRVSHASSDIPTFTASGVTEKADTGVYSGATVSYGHAIYIATEATGNPPSLNVTESSTSAETDNVVASLTLKTLVTSVSPSAGVAAITASGGSPSLTLTESPAAGTAAASVGGPGASVGIGANAGVASATASIQAVSVSTTPFKNAPAGSAVASVAVQQTRMDYASVPSVSVAATAYRPSTSIGNQADTANAVGAAYGPSMGFGVSAGIAQATGSGVLAGPGLGSAVGVAAATILVNQIVRLYYGSTRTIVVGAEIRTKNVGAENRTLMVEES